MVVNEGIIFEAGDPNQGTGEKGGEARMVQFNDQNSREEERKSQQNTQAENSKKFHAVVYGSSRVLLKIKTVFPFDLFPDQIVIDPNKVNVIRKSFFLTEKLHSISIKNVTDVYVQTAPFFASLHIMDNAVADNIIIVKYLWKKEAEKARRVIQGLIDAAKHEVDVHKLSTSEIDGLREKLVQSGQIPTKNISIKL